MVMVWYDAFEGIGGYWEYIIKWMCLRFFRVVVILLEKSELSILRCRNFML